MKEYEAHTIINIFGKDISLNIPYLEEESTPSQLRDIVLEYAYDSLYVKSVTWTSTDI